MNITERTDGLPTARAWDLRNSCCGEYDCICLEDQPNDGKGPMTINRVSNYLFSTYCTAYATGDNATAIEYAGLMDAYDVILDRAAVQQHREETRYAGV